MKRRLVIVSTDYLDGVQGTQWRKPDRYDESARLLPEDVVERYSRAEREWHDAQAALANAWAEATDRRNPGYIDPESE